MSKFMNYWEKGIECTLCKISVPCEVSYEINFNKRKLVKETKDFFSRFWNVCHSNYRNDIQTARKILFIEKSYKVRNIFLLGNAFAFYYGLWKVPKNNYYFPNNWCFILQETFETHLQGKDHNKRAMQHEEKLMNEGELRKSFIPDVIISH